MDRRWFVLLLAGFPAAAAPPPKKRAPKVMSFVATAHAQQGLSADGTLARPGTAAADPKVLPLGTRIRVTGAGAYSGVYTITDTGRAVKGRIIDLYVKTNAEARRFGRRRVKVTILEPASPK
jgi:3D (Asp-Asp-Asp) domain-containing protein